MSQKPFAPAPPSPIDIRVIQRRYELLQQQLADLALQTSQFAAERDVWKEVAGELQQELDQVKGAKK